MDLQFPQSLEVIKVLADLCEKCVRLEERLLAIADHKESLWRNAACSLVVRCGPVPKLVFRFVNLFEASLTESVAARKRPVQGCLPAVSITLETTARLAFHLVPQSFGSVGVKNLLKRQLSLDQLDCGVIAIQLRKAQFAKVPPCSPKDLDVNAFGLSNGICYNDTLPNIERRLDETMLAPIVEIRMEKPLIGQLRAVRALLVVAIETAWNEVCRKNRQFWIVVFRKVMIERLDIALRAKRAATIPCQTL
jgi:hypothetical protein